MELSSLEFYLCKLHIGGVSNDGTVCLFVPGVPNQLRIPHPEVMFSVSSWREDSYCRPLRDISVIYYKFCQGRPLLQLIVKPLKDWAGIPNTNLMFPLLVPYFMWLHMASNIPLAVVICLASKTWYMKWRIYVQINYFFLFMTTVLNHACSKSNGHNTQDTQNTFANEVVTLPAIYSTEFALYILERFAKQV